MAAENRVPRRRGHDPAAASMRPRRMAAENARQGDRRAARLPRFNEAAAHGRGKPRSPCRAAALASMRFNEAAAHGRGKHRRRRRRAARLPRFNEAAAHGRGKRPSPQRRARAHGPASMRPRRMAAENPIRSCAGQRHAVASMRPRRMAAENLGHGHGRPGPAQASMRPRRMAAENCPKTPPVNSGRKASMRPRRMAAENAATPAGCRRSPCRFNEAAAHGRGKRSDRCMRSGPS